MARLLLQTVEGPRTIELAQVNSLGRHPGNSIQVLDRIVSKEHCVIDQREGRFVLRDLGSMNGTYVNGERVHGQVALADGDEISMGATRAIFHADAAEAPPPPEPRPPEVPSERILVHLGTDRPVYHPGEMLYGRAAVLDAVTGAPASPTNLAFELRDAQGDVVVSRLSHAAEGVAPFSWPIPADLEPGDYRLYARCPTETFPPAELGFVLEAERRRELDVTLELSRVAYDAGEPVVAVVRAARLDGAALALATARAEAWVDGALVASSELTLDAEGRGSFRFQLPAPLERGEGLVTMVVRDGERAQHVERALPIELSRVQLSLFAEGGDLVVGLPSRLYLEARTPRGTPVEVAGRIVDAAGAVLAHFHTEHEGRGRVMLTPERAGAAYVALIDEPAGLRERFPLPEVAREGVSLICLDDRSGEEEPFHVRVISTSAGRMRLAVHRREQEILGQSIALVAGQPAELALKLPKGASGVLRVTLHDALGRPRAERLVFRAPAVALKVEIEALPPRPGPRAPVSVRVRTTARGRPVPATVMLSVVNEAALASVTRRGRPPCLPEQALLGNEVRELGDPMAYLAEGNVAARRMDLLLGTQGFRRFAFYDLTRFLGEQGDLAERVVARRRPPVVAVTQAVALLPETAPSAPIGRATERSTLELEAGILGVTQAAGRQRAAFGSQKGMRGPAPDAPALPPLPGPPLLMAVTAAQKAASIRARAASGATTPPPVGRMLTVREFAHRLSGSEGTSSPRPPPTLYWSAGITTSVNGEVTVELDVPGGVRSIRARADAVTADGFLGTGEASIEVANPVDLAVRLPVEVCAGDVLDLPVTLINTTPARADGRLSLLVEGPLITGRDPVAFSIAPESRERLLLPAAVIAGPGPASLSFQLSAGRHQVGERLCMGIMPAGFPAQVGVSGRIDEGGAITRSLSVPEAIEPGSIEAELHVAASPVASIALAFEALLGEPLLGFLPRLFAADLAATLLAHVGPAEGNDARLVRSALAQLDEVARSLGMLTVAGASDHAAGEQDDPIRVAFALMVSSRVLPVHPLDVERLDRARRWLLARRDRSAREDEALGQRALITWCLAQAGARPSASELDALARAAVAAEDATVVASIAVLLAEAGAGEAEAVLERLAERQQPNGMIAGAERSLLGARSTTAAVEATALAALAWVARGDEARARRAVDGLLQQGLGGRYGGSLAAALVGRALAALAALRPDSPRAAELELLVDGQTIARCSLGAGEQGTRRIPLPSAVFAAGERRVELRLRGGASLAYALSLRHHTRAQPSGPARDLQLSLDLGVDEVVEGEPVELHVHVVNGGAETSAPALVQLGLPGGLETRADLLDDLRFAGVIEQWSLRGRALSLCVSALSPSEDRHVIVPLLGVVPGTFRGPASSVSALLDDDAKTWVAPLALRVLASS